MKLTALISLGVIAGTALWAGIFNVKPGQWESTVTTQATGMPPIPQDVLDKMTPQQRQMMEERMKGTQTPRTTTNKSCVTKEDIEKGFNLAENDKACTRTVVSSDGRRQEIKLECNRGNGKQTGTIKIDASDPENVSGSMQMTMTSGARTMNMNATFKSRWLGPSCEKESK